MVENRETTSLQDEEEESVGTDHWKNFGIWFHQQLLAKGLTQREIAARTGLYPNSVHRICKGEAGARRSTLIKLAKAAEIDPDEMLEHAGMLNLATTRQVSPEAQLFGERIKVRLSYLGMTQKDLAEMLGVPYSRVRQWIASGKDCGIFMLPKIAKVLNTSLDYLMGTDYRNSTESRCPTIALDQETVDRIASQILDRQK